MKSHDGLIQTHQCKFYGQDKWHEVRSAFKEDAQDGLPIPLTDPNFAAQLAAMGLYQMFDTVPSLDGVVTIVVDVTGHGEFIVLLNEHGDMLASGRPSPLFATKKRLVN
jgi:hypothetical protein